MNWNLIGSYYIWVDTTWHISRLMCSTYKTCLTYLTRLIKWNFINIPFKPHVYKLISCYGLFSMIYCDWLFVILRYVLVLNDYLWYNYSLFFKFIFKIFIFLFFHKIFFLHFDKQIDTTGPFNKWVVLRWGILTHLLIMSG